MDNEQLRSTAYHEAGHAIVGWALKLQMRWSGIIAAHMPPPPPPPPPLLEFSYV